MTTQVSIDTRRLSDSLPDPDDESPSMDSLDRLHILTHPLLQHKLSSLRNKNTSPTEFRLLVKDLSIFLAIEASKTLQVKPIHLDSPLAPFTGYTLSTRLGLCPILRAGLGMTDALQSFFPNSPVFHLGLFRDSSTLNPVEYYQKLPKVPNVDEVWVLDPMIATGGTAVAAVNMVLDWGIPIEKIKLISLIASMPGLQRVMSDCSGLEVFVAGVDQEVSAWIVGGSNEVLIY